MKRNLLAASIALSIFTLVGCTEESADAAADQASQPATSETSVSVELSSPIQHASYGIGLNMGDSLLQEGLDDIDVDALAQGLQDALQGNEPRLDDDALMAAFTHLQTRAEERVAALAEEAQQANNEYLAENAARDGVMTTESGLQYEVVTAAAEDAAQPAANDMVTVHYEGRLLDGTVFDSSLQRGEPAQFPVSGVIPGWVEALQLMRVGDKWTVTIPSELAYGERSPSPAIPPNSVLVFDMELLGVDAAE